MRRLLALFALGALGTACTPDQEAAWWSWRAVDPIAADAYADDLAYGACAPWRDIALAIGWTPEQWPTLNRVMFGESGCEPDARNRSGATGLMQVMPGWADDCGGGDLYDPVFNLSCALYVFEIQGWPAWDAY